MDHNIDIREEPINIRVDDHIFKKKDGIFYVNSTYANYQLQFKNEDNFQEIRKLVKRLRNILNRNGTFRCEDLDILAWNTTNFRFVSGSTYIQDGNYEMFDNSIKEIERKVVEFSV